MYVSIRPYSILSRKFENHGFVWDIFFIILQYHVHTKIVQNIRSNKILRIKITLGLQKSHVCMITKSNLGFHDYNF